MKDWIPLFNAFVWPVFWAYSCLRMETSTTITPGLRRAHSVRRRIEAGVRDQAWACAEAN